MKDYLDSLTDKQLERLWERIYHRIGYGGHFGWDWPTLRIVHPHFYVVFRAIHRTLNDRAINRTFASERN